MTRILCPKCGTVATTTDMLPDVGWQPVTRRKLYTGTGALPVEDVQMYERVRPARKPSVSGHFSTPALQSLISGLAATMIFIPIAFMLGWRWWWPVLAGGCAFSLCWLFLLRYFNSLLREVELVQTAPERTRQKLTPEVTRLSVSTNEGHQEVQLNLSPEKILAIARGVVNAGRPFSEREWCGRGRLLASRAEYEHLRDRFIALGWLRWKDERNRQQGLEWTPAGTAGMKALASGRVRPERLLE